jgi:hypothetical protein
MVGAAARLEDPELGVRGPEIGVGERSPAGVAAFGLGAVPVGIAEASRTAPQSGQNRAVSLTGSEHEGHRLWLAICAQSLEHFLWMNPALRAGCFHIALRERFGLMWIR